MSAFSFKHCISILLISVLLFSCSFRSSGTSIDEKLAQVDSLIEVGDYNSAWTSLKRVAKTIRNSSETLGVVRRALLLQKEDFAKEQLINALKNDSDNQELLAVLSHMLVSENEYKEALPYAQKLEGGKYGSVYSELRFKIDEQALKEKNDQLDEELFSQIDYYSESYVQAYIDIFTSTGDAAYLRNAALVYALQGAIAKALSLHPAVLTSYESPLFWAQIAYDAYNFEQVIADLQIFEPTSDDLALLADAYVHLGLLEDAQITWAESTQRYSTQNPIAWHNIALYYQSLGEVSLANNTVLYLVETFPNYVEGLAAYGFFSLEDEILPPETVFSQLLKERGLKTLQMQLDSAIVHLDTQEAFLKMEESIHRLLQEDESRAIELAVEIRKLQWAREGVSLTNQQMVSDIWYMLEQYVQEPFGYHSVLVRFAMWFFFVQGMIEEADALFTTHCTSQYASHYETQGKYTRTPIEHMETWEYEYGGFLALKQERYDDAQKWLSMLMPYNAVSPATPIAAAINLSTLYNATGKRMLALSLYEQMLSYSSDNYLLADIHYRMALIYNETGDIKKASISLNEALSFDFNHSPSRLLLKKITN